MPQDRSEIFWPYNYGMDRDGNGLGTAEVGQTCYEGRTTATSALKSGDDTGTFESSLTIDKNDNDGNGDYNNVPYSRSFEFAGCTNGTRISWRTRSGYDAGLNNTTRLNVNNYSLLIAFYSRISSHALNILGNYFRI